MKEYLYCDAASTTPVSSEVLAEMIPYFIDRFGNPSSLHVQGEIAKEAVANARHRIANILGCKDNEIIFTSGATESNNIALKMAEGHVITSAYEHHSVLNPLQKSDLDITYLPVYNNGIVRLVDVVNAIKPNTSLVSIMAVNNEIGTVNPIEEIGRICKSKNILFHTDATQYIGHGMKKLDLEVIDMMSFSGHKFGAPKGIGVLYVKENIKLKPLMYGGQQESGLRPGTENVPYIVGIAKALESKKKNIVSLRDKLINELLEIPGAKLNGDRENRCPSIINISFEGIKGEVLAYMLNQYGIAVSTGSACASESDEPSHVLKAIGLTDEMADSSLRISLSDDITEGDINYIVKTIMNMISLTRGN